jgi:uncharacterized membrane protein
MSREADGVGSAAVLGTVTGARTFLAPAALALRGRFGGGRAGKAAKFVVPALAAGEIVGDKLPSAPPRVQGPGLVGRVLSGAGSGYAVGGARGARVGATFALAATYPSQLLRSAIVGHTPIPDIACAVPEDLLGAALAAKASNVDGPKTADIGGFSAHQPGALALAGVVGVGAALTAREWVRGFGVEDSVGLRVGLGVVFAAAAAVAYEGFSA